MEPSEFDQIVRAKLQEENYLHHHEVEKSKAFVWAEIRSNTKEKTLVIPWYYAVAAAVLFFLCFSLFFYQVQEQHHSEIQLLSNKMEGIQNSVQPATIVNHKNQQLDLLCSEIENLEQSLAHAQEKPEPSISSPQIVYQTDTVFIHKTEYITEYVPLPNQEKEDLEKEQIEGKMPITAQHATSDLIYPDFKASNNSVKESPLVKVKINTIQGN